MWQGLLYSLALLLLISSPAFAQGGGKIGKGKPAVHVTPEREAAVLTFVKQHHAELGELLAQLKGSKSKEYAKAIGELFRTSERLAQIQERDAEQYQLELKLWQAQSRAQLISARIKISDSAELREQLRTAAGEQVDARIELLTREREKTRKRLAAIDEQLKKMAESREQNIDRLVEVITGGRKTNPKPNVSKNGKSSGGSAAGS